MELKNMYGEGAFTSAVRNIVELNDHIETYDDYTMLQTAVNFLIESRYGLDTVSKINEIIRTAEKECRKE